MNAATLCKLTGVFLVMGGSGYYAYNLNAAMEKRNMELRKVYNLLLQLKSEMQYMYCPLPECFHKLSGKRDAPFGEWLEVIADRLEEKGSVCFQTIWKEETERLLSISYLKEEDVEPLSELSDKLGGVDMEVQMKSIDYTLLQLEKNRTVLENEIGQKKKVITAISMFSGLMTLILLL